MGKENQRKRQGASLSTPAPPAIFIINSVFVLVKNFSTKFTQQLIVCKFVDQFLPFHFSVFLTARFVFNVTALSMIQVVYITARFILN